MNLENHMVVDGRDAPWNRPDHDGVCDQCHDKVGTQEVREYRNSALPTRLLCEECAYKVQRAWDEDDWRQLISKSMPGDIVVITSKEWIRTYFVDVVNTKGEYLLALRVQSGRVSGACGITVESMLPWGGIGFSGFPEHFVNVEVISGGTAVVL